MSALESESSVASIDDNSGMYRREFDLENEEHSPEDVNTIGEYSDFEACEDEPLADENWKRNFEWETGEERRQIEENTRRM